MGSTILKYGLIALGIIGVLFGAYEYGHSSGYNSGYTVAWAAQQSTIQAMTNKENAQTTAQNKQITTVEQQAANAPSKIQQQTATTTKARDSVVIRYKKQYISVAQACGLDVPTVTAINQIIDADPFNAKANGVTVTADVTDQPTSDTTASEPDAASSVAPGTPVSPGATQVTPPVDVGASAVPTTNTIPEQSASSINVSGSTFSVKPSASQPVVPASSIPTVPSSDPTAGDTQ